MSVQWDYYDKFESVMKKYLPDMDEGETKATQIVTAVTKLVYKWYNDGDVFDNTNHLEGWANDLSSYANWLDKCTDLKASGILAKIKDCYNESDYENLLKELADTMLDEEYLAKQNKFDKVGTIYDCDGKYKFVESYDDEDDYY